MRPDLKASRGHCKEQVARELRARSGQGDDKCSHLLLSLLGNFASSLTLAPQQGPIAENLLVP